MIAAASTPLSNVQFGNPIAFAGVAEFTATMLAKLPPGDACAGDLFADLVEGAAQSFADFHARAAQLSEVETVPSQTVELLPFWEADYGLPDHCTPLGATLQQRHNALLAKIVAIGGQSAGYFIAVAAALGYAITITRGAVNSATWTINATAIAPPTVFRAGESRAGDLLESFRTNTQLECVMNQIKPADSTLIFSYS